MVPLYLTQEESHGGKNTGIAAIVIISIVVVVVAVVMFVIFRCKSKHEKSLLSVVNYSESLL